MKLNEQALEAACQAYEASPCMDLVGPMEAAIRAYLAHESALSSPPDGLAVLNAILEPKPARPSPPDGLVERLNEASQAVYAIVDESVATEISALLRAAAQRIEVLERMDREAATHVESVICMRTHFTGDPSYVGWKGLGLALNEALDERDALRAAASALRGKPGWVLVPVEPTDEMLLRGHHQIHWCRDGQNTFETEHPSQTPFGTGTTCKQDLKDAWSAMLAALPPVPTEPDYNTFDFESACRKMQEQGYAPCGICKNCRPPVPAEER